MSSYDKLTEEQELLVDKLILNEELKEHYIFYGLCNECKQPNTGDEWCQSCSAKHFQQNFKNWTKWIEYDKFENIEYITKGGFGTIYKASWKDKLKTVAEIYKQRVEADEINKKQPSFTKSDNKLTYTTHHQAIYTSRLLNFNNLPEPKNADDEEGYSKSIEPIDFTKLNINPQGKF
ncbi:hypothetical protein C1645_825406 [Glomus cerebriforme]|uniref:Protein kinase domain-containing protein n=1 Tax=Glomus cerebriforme TaxID=658196 RepID=A0A397SSF2_9GLOM|nr:hypothetical protein C1645_825406 [Glomus cerebriforme]